MVFNLGIILYEITDVKINKINLKGRMYGYRSDAGKWFIKLYLTLSKSSGYIIFCPLIPGIGKKLIGIIIFYKG